MKFLTSLLGFAFNHTSAQTALAYGLASNISAVAIGDSEWLKLSPYFEGDYWEQEGKQWKKYRQVVSKTHGEKLVTAFNAVRDESGERFRGLPIYRGHPDADPQRWPDERRLGGVMAIEAREDGIYAKVAWNDEGERNRQQGYLVYPSPAWPYDLRLKSKTGRIEPVELRSIGMTNSPRISGVPAWTNSDPANQPNENDMNLKALLLRILGLADTATDTEIETAANAFEAKVAAKNQAVLDVEKNKVVAACSERDKAQADLEKYRKVAINSIKTEAINSGKVTAAEWPGFETRLATNFDDTAKEISEKKPALNTDPLKITKRGDDISTPAGRTLAFNARITELTSPVAQGGKGFTLDAAIQQMRANADDAALLKAMEEAGQS
jgi:phage I-like protein